MKWPKCKSFNNYNIVFFKIHKEPGDIIILHLLPNGMIYSSWDIECDRLKLIITGPSCPFTLKFWKMKKSLETSFQTCLPQMTIIWCIVPEIWSATDRILGHFGLFFTVLSPENPENQNFEKMNKILGDITHVQHKWKSYVWFSWDIEHDRQNFFSFWTSFCPFTPRIT